MPEGKIRKPQVIGSSPIVGSTYLAENPHYIARVERLFLASANDFARPLSWVVVFLLFARAFPRRVMEPVLLGCY